MACPCAGPPREFIDPLALDSREWDPERQMAATEQGGLEPPTRLKGLESGAAAVPVQLINAEGTASHRPERERFSQRAAEQQHQTNPASFRHPCLRACQTMRPQMQRLSLTALPYVHCSSRSCWRRQTDVAGRPVLSQQLVSSFIMVLSQHRTLHTPSPALLWFCAGQPPAAALLQSCHSAPAVPCVAQG